MEKFGYGVISECRFRVTDAALWYCGDTLLNPLLAAGFGPRRSRIAPVWVATRSRKAGDPRGRPIVSAPRSAAIGQKREFELTHYRVASLEPRSRRALLATMTFC